MKGLIIFVLAAGVILLASNSILGVGGSDVGAVLGNGLGEVLGALGGVLQGLLPGFIALR